MLPAILSYDLPTFLSRLSVSFEFSTIASSSFYQPTLNHTFYVQSKNHDVAQTRTQRISGYSSLDILALFD